MQTCDGEWLFSYAIDAKKYASFLHALKSTSRFEVRVHELKKDMIQVRTFKSMSELSGDGTLAVRT